MEPKRTLEKTVKANYKNSDINVLITCGLFDQNGKKTITTSFKNADSGEIIGNLFYDNNIKDETLDTVMSGSVEKINDLLPCL